jgi:hypothetical protein
MNWFCLLDMNNLYMINIRALKNIDTTYHTNKCTPTGHVLSYITIQSKSQVDAAYCMTHCCSLIHIWQIILLTLLLKCTTRTFWRLPFEVWNLMGWHSVNKLGLIINVCSSILYVKSCTILCYFCTLFAFLYATTMKVAEATETCL